MKNFKKLETLIKENPSNNVMLDEMFEIINIYIENEEQNKLLQVFSEIIKKQIEEAK